MQSDPHENLELNYLCRIVKRIFSILILTGFIFSTVGVVASSYTCKMMEMKTSNCCSKTTKGCCEREVKLLKIDDDFVSSSSLLLQKFISTPVIISSPVILKEDFHSSTSEYFFADLAPPGNTIDRLSFIQSFLI